MGCLAGSRDLPSARRARCASTCTHWASTAIISATRSSSACMQLERRASVLFRLVRALSLGVPPAISAAASSLFLIAPARATASKSAGMTLSIAAVAASVAARLSPGGRETARCRSAASDRHRGTPASIPGLRRSLHARSMRDQASSSDSSCVSRSGAACAPNAAISAADCSSFSPCRTCAALVVCTRAQASLGAPPSSCSRLVMPCAVAAERNCIAAIAVTRGEAVVHAALAPSRASARPFNF